MAHIHALEHDRSGDNMNRDVAGIERAGLEAADRVVAVRSHYASVWSCGSTEFQVDEVSRHATPFPRSKADRVYAVPERRTREAGPVHGARHVPERAGLLCRRPRQAGARPSGCTVHQRQQGHAAERWSRQVAQLRIGSHFHFTGFLKDEEVDHMYAVSDLYVMPSVSEPAAHAPP